MECRKYLKKKGKQITRKLKQELIFETNLNFKEPIVFMKQISRNFLAVVFEKSSSIQFFDLKTFELSVSLNLGATVTSLQTCLIPGSFEDHQENIMQSKVDLETLNYRQPYIIVGDSEGKIHLVNTSTLSSEHSFYSAEGGITRRPVIACFSSLFDCCVVSIDTDLYLRLHSIEKS
jgi:hypothetical protein